VQVLKLAWIHDHDPRTGGLGDGHCVGHREDFEARSHCEQEISLLRCLHGAVDDCGHRAQPASNVNARADRVMRISSISFDLSSIRGQGRLSDDLSPLLDFR
jgi:hypothetical protein